jgi:hypothetical protein
MTDPAPQQTQPDDIGNPQAPSVNSTVRRKISVKGSGGVSATVVVMVLKGTVRVSIVPPFTWEAIMAPEKIDELIRTLGLARDEAKQMVRDQRVSRGTTQQPGCTTTVVQGHKALHTKQDQP